MPITRGDLINNIKKNLYMDHQDGEALLNIDLNQMIENAVDNTQLYVKIAEQKQRILYLEMMENDLLAENAILRTRLFNCNDDGN